VTGWAWTFGDGNTSTNQNPSDIYLNPGSYTVQEIVTGNGGSGTNTQTALITVYDPFAWWQQNYGLTNNCALCGPNASYTGDGMSNTNKFMTGFNPTNAAAYLHIISIAETNNNINVIYLGANGDNTWSPGIASRTNVLEFTAGTASGNYSDNFASTGQTNILSGGTGLGVVTNMIDVGGATNGLSRYYRVRVLGAYQSSTSSVPPVASFTASPTSGAAPLNVGFTDQSSGSVTGWAWTFGDGNTSTNQNPSDIYLNPGSYTVQEIVTGNGGAGTNTQTALINVYDPFAWWQLQYFGTNTSASTAPGGDYTGTGMSNTNKFMTGFNPTNAAAYLHVISIAEQSVAGSNNVVVTYLGASGDNTYVPGIASRTNVLDYMTGDANGNYTNGGWQDTGQTNILSGGNGYGTVTNLTDTAIPGIPTNRYYRVRVVLP
jgi:PKD repeat protein